MAKKSAKDIENLRVAAEDDDDAAMALANCYLEGESVNQDLDEARKWFYKGIDIDANLGDCIDWMFGNANHQDVTAWIQAGIARRDPEFMIALSSCYCNGTGVEQDDLEALKWAREAAKLGDEDGQYQYCYMVQLIFQDETHLSLSDLEGIQTFLHGLAEEGDAEASYMLGIFYSNDQMRGVFFNQVGATHPDQANRPTKENPNLAFECFRTAVEKIPDRTYFAHALGKCYMDGYGVKQNLMQGFRWLLVAAQEGFVPAKYIVSNCYREGIGVDKNLEEAKKWLEKYEK